MRFKAIIFDFGDTLILTDQWDYDKCLSSLLKSLQDDNVATSIPYDEFKRVYFEVRNEMYVDAESSLKEVIFQQRIAETLRRFSHNTDYDSSIILRAAEAFTDNLMEDLRMEYYVPTLLSQLKKSYKLGLVSNFAYAPGLRKILAHFSLTKFFDVIMISGELGVRKPHPKIFEEALDKLGVAAEESVFVGDSLKADINGAKKLGSRTVLVENVGLRKNPYAIPGELGLYPVKPDAKIPSLKSLPAILETL